MRPRKVVAVITALLIQWWVNLALSGSESLQYVNTQWDRRNHALLDWIHPIIAYYHNHQLHPKGAKEIIYKKTRRDLISTLEKITGGESLVTARKNQ